jgi:hypothetical protein
MPGTPSGFRDCTMQVDKFRAILKWQGGVWASVYNTGNGCNLVPRACDPREGTSSEGLGLSVSGMNLIGRWNGRIPGFPFSWALAKSITGYHKNKRKQCPVLELANQMPVRNMDLARASRRTAGPQIIFSPHPFCLPPQKIISHWKRLKATQLISVLSLSDIVIL